MAFAFEIKDRLVAQGVGVYGVSLGIGSKVVIPSNLGQAGGPTFHILLKQTGGTGSAKTQNNTATQRPTLQVVVRSNSAEIALNTATLAYNALGGPNGIYNTTLSGVFYLSITVRQEPTDIGLDERGMPMYSFNIDAEKAPS